MKNAALITLVFMLSACVGVPEGITPVAQFERDRYMGTWYEIARLDNRFEEGMSQVTANYRVNEDGSVRVLNRGYIDAEDRWAEAEGVAKFVDQNDVGHLKVSFFGPFYSSYIVYELADDYSYSFVTSRDKDYLWFLARTPEVDEALKQHFVERARTLGFAHNDILFIDQSQHTQQ
ncbi:MAG TPA: lipocalin family protein [Pseudomonadales bacterium]|nr:lipocalin family protein [Pseudomonadales bacterium]